MSDLFVYTLPAFLVVISVIIVIHELGHYWMARLFGTRIDAFAFGFGPEIVGWTDKLGTRWKICLLPLGGYVKFHGDENAASVPDKAKLQEIRRKIASEGLDPNRVFHLKPIYQRSLIVLAGPLANFVLAIALFAGYYSIIGEPYQPTVIEKVLEGSPAEAAGLRPGDQVIEVDGKKIFSFNDLSAHIRTRPDRVLTLTILRDGAELKIAVRPERKQIDMEAGSQKRRPLVGQIGIQGAGQQAVEIHRHSLGSAILRGIERTELIIKATYFYLIDLVTLKQNAEQLGGPVAIAQAAGDVAKSNLDGLIIFIAIVSVGVGLVNLFPIPVLDGGHLLFYAIEAIQGRPLSAATQEIGFRIGLALLVFLFLFVTWNDIT